MEAEPSDKIQLARAEIHGAFSAAIRFVISFAADRGFERKFPERTVNISYFKPVDATRSTLITERRSKPSFTSFYFNFTKEIDGAEPVIALNQICEHFKKVHGVDMGKYFQAAYGTLMCRRYFEKIGSFTYNMPALSDVLDEFISDLTARQEHIELVYYVEGLSAESSFNLLDNTVSFSAISENDLLRFAEQSEVARFARGFDLNIKGWICRILRRGSKSDFDDFNNATDTLEQVLNAIALISDGNACFRLLAKRVTNTFLDLGQTSGGEPLNSGRGNALHLLVVQVSTDPRLKLLRQPLRRMRAAASRRSLADAFVDTIIALEGLLAHDTPALESTYRFRLRGAALLPGDFGSAEDRLKLLGQMYSTRSRIVHGDDQANTIDSLINEASKVLRAVLLRYFELSEQIKPEDIVRRVDEWMVRSSSCQC